MLEIERIGKLRRQLELTQKELANLAGVSQSLIAKIESGRIDPAYSKVMKILSALEADLNKNKKKVAQIMTKSIVHISPNESVDRAVSLMRSKDISQLPVMEHDHCVGSISDSIIVELLSGSNQNSYSHLPNPHLLRVRDVMKESFPSIPLNSTADAAATLLRHYSALLISDRGKIVGILTKADLLKEM